MPRQSEPTLVRSVAALALVAGLAVASACGADQAAQQTGASDKPNGAIPRSRPRWRSSLRPGTRPR